MQRHRRTLGIAAAIVIAGGAGFAVARERGLDTWTGWSDAPAVELSPEEEADQRERLRAELAGLRQRRRDKEVLVRSGSWRGRKGEQHRWRARLERDRSDGRLSGEVTIDGSALAGRGRVEGRINGRSVQGTVNDDRGRRIARFTGTVSGDSLSGTYEARDGERGTWTYP